MSASHQVRAEQAGAKPRAEPILRRIYSTALANTVSALGGQEGLNWRRRQQTEPEAPLGRHDARVEPDQKHSNTEEEEEEEEEEIDR